MKPARRLLHRWAIAWSAVAKSARRLAGRKWAIIWPAVALVLLVGLGAALIGLHATSTADQARRANSQTVAELRARVACLNATLANRNGPTKSFAHHLYLETKIHNPTPAQRVHLQRSTAEAIKRWYIQLRDNPLGHC